MPIENHSLVNEFPEHKETIHNLKMEDRHFHHLFEKYDDTTHAIYRYETGSETTSDEHLETLKKERLTLKDQLYAIILKAAPAAQES
jgi:uncharacterized protein YdcH (DUF465 family)